MIKENHSYCLNAWRQTSGVKCTHWPVICGLRYMIGDILSRGPISSRTCLLSAVQCSPVHAPLLIHYQSFHCIMRFLQFMQRNRRKHSSKECPMYSWWVWGQVSGLTTPYLPRYSFTFNAESGRALRSIRNFCIALLGVWGSQWNEWYRSSYGTVIHNVFLTMWLSPCFTVLSDEVLFWAIPFSGMDWAVYRWI